VLREDQEILESLGRETLTTVATNLSPNGSMTSDPVGSLARSTDLPLLTPELPKYNRNSAE